MSDCKVDFMQIAMLLAQKAADEGEVPVGALVVQQGQIIGRGYNQRERCQNPLGHAEMIAIHEASQNLGSWRLTGCQLIVTLEPCPMCLGAAQQARIDEVIYGAQDKKGGALSLGYRLHEDTQFNHRFPVHHYPMAQCGEILSQFFAQRRVKKSK
ncbi:MAG: nucleoside deaminase [Bdellovibrionia bacterium]